MAVKYQVPGLGDLASKKFAEVVQTRWNDDHFAKVVTFVHGSTPEQVTELRTIVNDTICDHMDDFKQKDAIEAAILSVPCIVFDLLKRVRGPKDQCVHMHAGTYVLRQERGSVSSWCVQLCVLLLRHLPQEQDAGDLQALWNLVSLIEGCTRTVITCLVKEYVGRGETWSLTDCQSIEAPAWADVNLGLIKSCHEPREKLVQRKKSVVMLKHNAIDIS